MSFSDLAGNIPVSKITGLDSVVGNGIADYNVSNGQTENENGYAKFKNGLTFQWGRVSPKSAAVNFLKAFSSQCFNVTISLEVPATITLTETISAGGSSSTTPATNGVIVGQIVPDTITETYEAGTTIKAPVFFCGLTPETIRTTGFKFWINCADADKLRATIFFNYMKLHYFAVGV